MKRLMLALCLAASAQATDLQWNGGDLQYHFSSNPYHEREPKITAPEAQVLNTVVKLVKEHKGADAIAEIKQQLNRQPSAALWFALAQLQQQQKNDAQAILSLRKAVELLPHFTRAHEALGRLLTQTGEYTSARRHLRQAASQGSKAEIFAMLGYGYLQTNQPQAAQSAYSHALMLAGENPQWQRGLLYAALAASDHGLARSMTDQLLTKAPNDAQLYRLRASLAQRQQRWAEVISSLEIAHQLAPDSETRWQLAQIYLAQGYYALAQPHLRQLLSKTINERQTHFIEMADYLMARQQLKQAEEILDTLLNNAILTDNERSHVLTSKAKLLAIHGAKSSLQGQTKHLHQALTLNPANGPALLALAELYENNHQAHQAEALYQRAAVLPPVRLEALQRHAQLLLRQEAYQRAELLMQQAVKYAPENTQLQNNLALVSRMVNSHQ